MGRYLSPRGVEIEMSDEAARAIGYAEKQAEPATEPRRRRKKPDESAEAEDES